jgi:large subunit ribosomal protein L3
MIGILGKKLGMSRIIDEKGNFVPVTYVQIMDNEVLQVKTVEKDGFSAIVLGFDAYKRQTKNKKYKHIKEIKVDDSSKYKLGQKINLNDLEDLKIADIVSFSKGKGFQGPVRRWNFKVARKTHGTKDARHGSTMSSSITGRSKPGIKMAGRMGGQKVTLKRRKIISVFAEKNIYAVKGPIPGANKGLVILKTIS